MIVVRFKVQCQPDQTAEMVDAMSVLVRAARESPGVVQLDIARTLDDADALIATEVFEDRAAMEREEALPEVQPIIALMQSGAPSAPPEWTIFDVASADLPSL